MRLETVDALARKALVVPKIGAPTTDVWCRVGDRLCVRREKLRLRASRRIQTRLASVQLRSVDYDCREFLPIAVGVR